MPNRRELLASTGAVGIGSLLGQVALAQPAATTTKHKEIRIGVISARNRGETQRTNGHTWQFTESFHKQCNMDAIRKLLDPGRVELFEKHLRNPREHFNIRPHHDVRVTHYYEKDPTIAKLYTEAFPGVEVAGSVEQMVKEVDAVWLGDGSGIGDDHFDLIAPALEAPPRTGASRREWRRVAHPSQSGSMPRRTAVRERWNRTAGRRSSPDITGGHAAGLLACVSKF